MQTLFGLLFMLIGGALMEVPGALAGLCFGVLTGRVLKLDRRLQALTDELAGTRERLDMLQADLARLRRGGSKPDVPAAIPAAGEASPGAAVPPTPAETLAAIQAGEAPADRLVVAGPGSAIEPPPSFAEAPPAPSSPATTAPGRAGRLLAAARAFFTTGNVIVKLGVVVLFFGVSFLLRYAVERNALPIELRLAGTAVAAVVLLGLGWRLRHRRGGYARVLQGGAVGVLYLTVFAAAKLYAVLPAGLAFVLMLAIVGLSGLLAVLQDARSLAVLGTSGGFLAPVLMSTGAGSHVALFSYYALLNAGVFGIAWFRSWRILNWLGFVFTFVIGTAWGVLNYRASQFASVEPFLLLFFLFYFLISIVHAQRQPPRLKGYVDGSLVFGLPLIAFTLQSALVREFEFGRSLSALGLAALYLLAARWCHRRRDRGLELLAEAFLALGVLFTTLAIPFALDGHWSAATWSIEGAGLLWVGVRQRRLRARVFGALLQVGAGIVFFALAADSARHASVVLNTAFLGSVFVALAGVFSAFNLDRPDARLGPREAWLAPLFLGWGLAWWFGAALAETERHLGGPALHASLLTLTALSFLAAAQFAQAQHWRRLMHWCVLHLPLVLLVTLSWFLDYSARSPARGGGWLAWPLAVLVSAILLWRFERIWAAGVLAAWHVLTACLAVFVCAWAVADLGGRLPPGGSGWTVAGWGIIGAAALALLRHPRFRACWPARAHAAVYRGMLPAVMAVVGLLWVLAACLHNGAASPLAWLPLLSPVDLAQALVLTAVAAWYFSPRQPPAQAWPLLAECPRGVVAAVLGVVGFVLVNTLVARAVHHFDGVPWYGAALARSPVFQTGISIVWGLVALLLMALARGATSRAAWFAGAAVLAALVLKLFLVDLSDTGTVARIVSFLGAGVIMLVMGYFAPLPPRLDAGEGSR